MKTPRLLLLALAATLPPATAELLTNNAYPDQNPQISDSLIVWEAQPDGADTEIMVHYQGETRQLTDNTGDDTAVALSGSTLVWQSWDGTDWELWGYNAASDMLLQLTDNTVDDTDPHIAGDHLVYTTVDGGDTEIATLSLGLLIPEIAEMKVTPQALKLTSRGKWVNLRLSLDDKSLLDEGIDPDTVRILGSVTANQISSRYGNLFIRVDRAEFSAALEGHSGATEIDLVAQTYSGSTIVATDTIKVIP
ncbi:hypothetical protein HNR46_001199 [Haloferula luteola]|uniref:Uncharacterized protein n=1 Tax=Haloferula luteola TaxID=595692 RepID=A0A840UYZ8_9BACT|nr:hypothetical protein [Haloferula luteola]MBB5350965.1 hypothetical protein [Haloferula luteola]